ncbi:MAG: DUF3306 domain-containing protein [Pseudolabrys sp.]
MSEPKDFLARWSRRKRGAAEGAAEKPVTGDRPPTEADEARQAAAPAPETGSLPKPAFDVASLPPIDSIDATSDVTAFLRKGVPAELARAALRRAWVADPAIRNFVGLAENAWDFNDPNAMAGFGPLDQSPEQVRQMVADLFGETRRVADQVADMSSNLPSAPAPLNVSSDLAPQPIGEPTALRNESDDSENALRPDPEPASSDRQTNVAMQHEDQEAAQPQGRIHGGALPK